MLYYRESAELLKIPVKQSSPATGDSAWTEHILQIVKFIISGSEKEITAAQKNKEHI